MIPPRSRNAREGRFVGVARGKPVRVRRKLRKNVRAALARAFLRGRIIRSVKRAALANDEIVFILRPLGKQGAR